MRAKTQPWLVLPIFDGQGHFSPLKSVCLVALTLPALWLAYSFTSGEWDFPSPFVPLIYHSGLWTAYLLLASLAITPLRKILRWGRLQSVRRMVGVASFFYLLVHIYAWIGLRFFDFESLVSESLSRPSLWIAIGSTLVLAALTLTSLDRAVQRMGGENWRRLHQLVYGATLAGLIHFLLSPGSLVGAPFLLIAILFFLLTWRMLDDLGLGSKPSHLLVLTLLSSAASLGFQLYWLSFFQTNSSPVDPWPTLFLTLDPTAWEYLGLPPALIILALGLTLTILAKLRAR